MFRRAPVDSERVRFRSYGRLDAARPEVFRPRATDDIRAVFATLGAQKRTLAFRAGGGAFHDQSLSDDCLVVLDEMPRGLTTAASFIEADAQTTVGEALAAGVPRGSVPAVMPTSQRITLGGCLASNVISRFSPAYGKFSERVLSFELSSPDGTRREVVRPAPGTTRENDALYRAVPGSFGYLGYVSRLKLATVRLPFQTTDNLHDTDTDNPPAPPRVATSITPLRHFDDVIDGLVRDYLDKNLDPRSGQLKPIDRGPSRADATMVWALTDPNGLGGILRSRLVPADTPLRPFWPHAPDSLMHRAGQILSASRAWIDLGWKLSWKTVAQSEKPFVDELSGFSFMMDGNWRARAWAARFGLDIWLLQQSYVLPIDLARSDPGAAAKRFLAGLSREVRDRRIKIGVVDLLTCPPDNTVLSSVNGTGGVVMSLAVHGVSRRDAARVIELLRRLGRLCAEEGGCIHLVKHVHAEPEVLRQMYQTSFAELLQHKQTLDPHGVIRNAFFGRLAAACLSEAGHPLRNAGL